MNPFNIVCPTSWNLSQKKRFQELAKDPIVVLAYWNSDENGLPCNGGSTRGKPAAPGLKQKTKGLPLKMYGKGALHATGNPSFWSGKKIWIVALSGMMTPIAKEKMGATQREILGEISLKDPLTFEMLPLLYKDKKVVSATIVGGGLASQYYFEDCDLSFTTGAFIQNSYLQDCNLNISNAKCYHSYFEGCRINTPDTEYYYSYFSNCNFDDYNFEKFKYCYFSNCSFPLNVKNIMNNAYSFSKD